MRCQIHIRAIGQLERVGRRGGVEEVSEGKKFVLCWSIVTHDRDRATVIQLQCWNIWMVGHGCDIMSLPVHCVEVDGKIEREREGNILKKSSICP